MENQTAKKGSYFLGIIGGALGGLILATLVTFGYSFTELIYSLALTIVIPIAEFYGYKLLKGEMDSKLPKILEILTIIVITVMMFVILPAVLLVKFGLPITWEEISSIYANRNIFMTILQDYLLSVVFAGLGTYIVVTIINRKLLSNVDTINLFSSDNKENQELKEISMSVLKPVFEKYGAINKETTITKEEILADIKDNNLKKYFDYLKQLKIIKKYKGKYYYSVDDEKNIKIHYSISKIIAIICTVIILTLGILISFGLIMNSEVKRVYNAEVSFKIDTSWNLLEDYEEETGWVYYKYFNETEENIDDSYPLTIGIAYDNNLSESYNSINDLKTTLETYLNEYLNYEYNISLFTTSKGYDAIELVTSYGDAIEIDYYIYNKGKMAYITAISYTNEEDVLDTLEKYARNVSDSFEWNK